MVSPHDLETGTTKVKNLEQNAGSLAVKLSRDDIKEICTVVSINEVSGGNQNFLPEYSWKHATTPAK